MMNGDCVLIIENSIILQLKIDIFYQIFENYKIVSTELKSLQKWISVALIT